jgi:hypothetical protein
MEISGALNQYMEISGALNHIWLSRIDINEWNE